MHIWTGSDITEVQQLLSRFLCTGTYGGPNWNRDTIKSETPEEDRLMLAGMLP